MSGLRPVTAGDVDAMTANIVRGFETYRAFAPRAWEPPSAEDHRDRIVLRMRIDGFAGWIAPTGRSHVAGYPLEEEPGVWHLFHLFVDEAAWGTGLAAELLARAVGAAAASTADAMRLFTPAGQARARAFDGHEGWHLHVEPYFEPHLGMDMVELRRPL
ncbi:GNAT family N-acetyltransferase [Paraconexibacter antarcticus]|uniref:GNAT family N-acetyltransferase n=1 Tax=Paraconexibacter antarcticus TaxID=2949664 RepID=A0ABY5DPT2_9ACTN|nr:GNAT family N-acetyltransferase [Paraconexibacter antarcticus]UTI62881.1 GNAT family N-acetyltransferase [Paraconexibacter antarcticus]